MFILLSFSDQFTDDDIIGNAILLFGAGAITISSTVSFCLYELALNKEIQDKMRAEICSMKAKHDGQLNNDFLMDLHYTNMVLEGKKIFRIIMTCYLSTLCGCYYLHREELNNMFIFFGELDTLVLISNIIIVLLMHSNILYQYLFLTDLY